MLAQRLGSAAVLIPIVVAVAYVGGWWFFGLWLGALLIAVREFYNVLRHGGLAPSWPLMAALFVALMVDGQLPQLALDRAILAAALVAASAWQLARPAEVRSLADWGMTLVPSLYIGWLGAALLLVRNAPQGWRWTLFVFLAVFATDSSAYFAGRAFGRTPFAPTISPKKTWEGAVTGWAYTTLLAVGLARFLQLPVPPLTAAVLGLSVSLVATIGDLTMSFVKRQGHVKDSSHLIPGHGGLLDRVDSVLPAAAVVQAYLEWLAR